MWLSELRGARIVDRDFRRSIEVYNRGWELMQQLYELRKRERPPVTRAETLEVVKAATRLPREQLNQLLEQLLDEITRTGREIKKGKRLMVVGSELENSTWIETIEKLGAVVVTDELEAGTRYFWDKVDTSFPTMEALARYFISGRPPGARTWPDGTRFEHIFNMVEQYKVDGVISEIRRNDAEYGHDRLFLDKEMGQHAFRERADAGQGSGAGTVSAPVTSSQSRSLRWHSESNWLHYGLMRKNAAKQDRLQVEPGSTEPLYKQLARILTQRIMQGDLAPGAALSERDLAEQYSVTRDTVRGAVHVLGTHGLVRRQPRKGTVVADVSRVGQRFVAAPTILVRESRPSAAPSAWFDGIYQGIQTVAQDMGYDLKRERLGDPLDVPLSQYETPNPSNVGGVILYGVYDQRYMEMFRSDRVPLVIADYWANDLVTDCVAVDVEGEAYAVVEFLARLGHRSLGLAAIGRMGRRLGRHEYDPDIHLFLSALRRAGPRHGVEIQDGGVLLTPTVSHMEAACPGYLATQPCPTAIVCFGQLEASAVLAAAKSAGLRCPHDFSLIVRRAEQEGDPALTSLVSDPELVGRMAVKLLSERMHGLRIRAAKLALSSRLVVGETTGPAPIRA